MSISFAALIEGRNSTQAVYLIFSREFIAVSAEGLGLDPAVCWLAGDRVLPRRDRSTLKVCRDSATLTLTSDSIVVDGFAPASASKTVADALPG